MHAGSHVDERNDGRQQNGKGTEETASGETLYRMPSPINIRGALASGEVIRGVGEYEPVRPVIRETFRRGLRSFMSI